jgi:predicted RND superfamily exporter protein
MLYRKISFICLIFIAILTSIQGFYLHKQLNHFSQRENEIRKKWKENPPVLCPAVYPCDLKGDVYFNAQMPKQEMQHSANVTFFILGMLSLPCFVFLFKKKK